MAETALMHPGVTGATEALGGSVWRILGQTYTPKVVSESGMVWHAVIPPGAGTPPHIHPTQDEWIVVLDGALEVDFASRTERAGPGDAVRMPMGLAHAVVNRSGTSASCLFGVSPTRKLFAFFNAAHDLDDRTEIARLAGLHELEMLPQLGR